MIPGKWHFMFIFLLKPYFKWCVILESLDVFLKLLAAGRNSIWLFSLLFQEFGLDFIFKFQIDVGMVQTYFFKQSKKCPLGTHPEWLFQKTSNLNLHILLKVLVCVFKNQYILNWWSKGTYFFLFFSALVGFQKSNLPIFLFSRGHNTGRKRKSAFYIFIKTNQNYLYSCRLYFVFRLCIVEKYLR